MAFQLTFNLQNCSLGTCNYEIRYGDTTWRDFLTRTVRWFCQNDKTNFTRIGWFSEQLGQGAGGGGEGGGLQPPGMYAHIFNQPIEIG